MGENLLQAKLNTMRQEIRTIFVNASMEAEKILNNMKVTVDQEIENYNDLKIQTQTEVKHGYHKRGFLGLWREHYTEEVTINSATISDVVSNLRGYINRCTGYVNEEFEKILDIPKFENNVKETVMGAFDLSGSELNENEILIPLESIMNKVKIPQIDIEIGEAQSLMIKTFPAVVKGEELQQLILMQHILLGDASRIIREELDRCRDNIREVMTEQSDIFVDNVIDKLAPNIEKSQRENL